MLHNIRQFVLEKPDENYLKWLFPQNKNSIVNGLVFTFITISSLSLVDAFYYSDLFQYPDKAAALAAGGKTFQFDNFLRLIIAPFINLAAIFLAKSSWNKSMKNQEIIAGVVILVNLLSFLSSGIYNNYYTAAEDFAYDILVLILFSQTLFGLPFRTSFLYNAGLVLVSLIYLLIDDDELPEFVFALTLVLLVWIPVLLGTLKLERSRLSNFKTIFKLKDANQQIAKQKNLLKAGENVSQMASWHTSNNFKEMSFSGGIYQIYELKRNNVAKPHISKAILQLIHPDDAEKVAQQLKNLSEGNFSPSTEHRILLPDGRVKWLKATIGHYIEGEGYYGTIQDITRDKLLELELKKNAKELKVKNEELQQFAYASSHDLQEPLRSITNFVNILNKKLNGQLTSEHKMYMDIVLNSTARMKDLINAILDYSRIGRNKTLETFDCNEVLKNVLIDLNFSILESKGLVQFEKLPIIVGYKTEFSLLLQNLISNALKFRRAGIPPLVKVEAIINQNKFHFRVHDNGIGLDPKHANRIFQLFSRLHSQEAYKGTGIGLTHSKKIVELHGGKIWVESTLDQGTTFHFTIPKHLNTNINEKEVKLHLVN